MDSSITSTPRTSTKKILVLDANGILFLKKPKKYSSWISRRSKRYSIIHRDFYDIYIRPGWKDFLRWCFKHYRVGIFSSTYRENVEPLLNYIRNHSEFEFLFVWTREMCSLDPSPQKDWDTIKELDRIVKSPIINRDRNYTLDQILAIEDNPRKHRFNPKNTYQIVEGWEMGVNDNFEALISLITLADWNKSDPPHQE